MNYPGAHNSDLAQFRDEVRRLIERDCPAAMREPQMSDEDGCWGGRGWTFASEDQRLWLERAIGHGWTAPTWPRRYGGGEMTHQQEEVLRDELNAAGCRLPLAGWGLTLVGPTLLRYGTEAQKEEHLPRISRGDIRWCQGFSEPGAGSDLASLQTRAELDGDHFVVNGQKVWTTFGDRSDWIFCLVRTDRNAPKHQGISFLLIDMASPGVTVRPIPLISGTSEFCEVFFDGVRVPATNLVGALNGGWEVAKYLLGVERRVSGKAKAQLARSVGQQLADARRLSPAGRLEAARLDIESWGQSMLLEEMAALAQAGVDRPGFGQVVKYVSAELNKWRYELFMSEQGSEALLWSGPDPESGTLARTWLRTKANSIAGGSNEMQLNMTAKLALGLPDKPSQRATSGETVDFSFDHRQIRETACAMIAAARDQAGVRAVRNTPDRSSEALWRVFAQNGLTGLLVPEGCGGSNLGHAEASLIVQELGRAMVPSPFLSTSVIAASVIAASGDDNRRHALLARIADGSIRVAVAVDEDIKHGGPIATTAAADGDGWLLNGNKVFVADGASADIFIVAAIIEGESGVGLFLVDRSVNGLSVARRELVDHGPWADVGLRSVKLAPEAFLARTGQGDAMFELMLDAGRAGAAGELLGIGDEACDRTIAYLKERRQFDHFLAEYQALQHRIAIVHMRLEVARVALRRAVRHLDANDGERASAVAAAKFLATGAATLAVQEAVQMHGGVAMTDAYDLGFLMKRARVLAELYGDANFQAERFARSLGY